jgi:hypothetical protein
MSDEELNLNSELVMLIAGFLFGFGFGLITGHFYL